MGSAPNVNSFGIIHLGVVRLHHGQVAEWQTRRTQNAFPSGVWVQVPSCLLMKKVLILFGEMGSGKNYWGEKFSQSYGLPFFDGDDVVTEEMRECISKFKPLNKDMIKRFVPLLANAIADRAEENGLVVAQALYTKRDREFIRQFLVCLGYDVEMRWIKTSLWRNLKQLYSRKNGMKWIVYWLVHKPFFQAP